MPVHHGYRLKNLLEIKRVNLSQLVLDADISRATLYNYFETEEIPRKKLLKICEVAGIGIDEIYAESGTNDPATEYKAIKERIKTLEEMLHDKDVIIIQQNEIIELLKGKNQKRK